MATLPTVVPKLDGQDLRLIEAARSGDSHLIRRLLDEGAEPDEADANGLTALIMASSVGELEAVNILLSAGADTGKKDNLGDDAYHAAMFHGDFRGATVTPYDQIMKLLKSRTRP